jgi:hypothetical protein
MLDRQAFLPTTQINHTGPYVVDKSARPAQAAAISARLLKGGPSMHSCAAFRESSKLCLALAELRTRAPAAAIVASLAETAAPLA